MRAFVEGSPEEIKEFLKLVNPLVEKHLPSDVENIEKATDPTRMKKTK